MRGGILSCMAILFFSAYLVQGSLLKSQGKSVSPVRVVSCLAWRWPRWTWLFIVLLSVALKKCLNLACSLCYYSNVIMTYLLRKPQTKIKSHPYILKYRLSLNQKYLTILLKSSFFSCRAELIMKPRSLLTHKASALPLG